MSLSTRTKFILAILALLAVFVFAEYKMPRKFSWVPTFSHTDGQPFGCQLFDSLLAVSMPKGYTVTNRSLWQMEKDSVFSEPKAVMIVTNEGADSQLPIVLRLASKGNVVLVATTSLSLWADTLGIHPVYHTSFNIQTIAGKTVSKGRLRWENDTLRQWPLYPQLVERTLRCPDSVAHSVLARFRFYDDMEIGRVAKNENSDWADFWQPVAVSFPIGDGELILVSAPLLLTNYMVMSGEGHRFIAHLMDRVKHLPVIRTERYMQVTALPEQSPLYVLLQKPPLRWAVYLTMLTLLLFCMFTARRRQRVIPVIDRPANANLEFVRLIGTLFWQQHDNAALLARKLAYTADTLRRDMGIDITALIDNHPPSGPAPASGSTSGGLPAGTVMQLAAYTGRDPEELRLLLHNICQAASGYYEVSNAELKAYIDELDRFC